MNTSIVKIDDRDIPDELVEYINFQFEDKKENHIYNQVTKEDVELALDNLEMYVDMSTGKITGLMVVSFDYAAINSKHSILKLLSLTSLSSRSTYRLLKHFIDLDKKRANSVIMNRSADTNLKHETLKKLGFEPMEVVYRLEV